MESIAEQIVRLLENAGCRKAFGVSEGYIFPLWHALEASSLIDVYHCRSEGGAAFAAMESSLHQNNVSIVFTTSGPGTSNAYTALRTARTDGARVIVLSAVTARDEGQSRKAQETIPAWVMASTGVSFQYPFSNSWVVHDRNDLSEMSRDLPNILSTPAVCLGIFMTVATQNLQIPCLDMQETVMRSIASDAQDLKELDLSGWANNVRDKLERENCVLWVGFGARYSATNLLRVVEHFDVPVVTTPRAKGIFPETHPLAWGCTGLGGTVDMKQRLSQHHTSTIIILGSRLEETSSSFIQMGLADKQIIVIDRDPSAALRRNFPPHAVMIRGEINRLLGHLAGDSTNGPTQSLQPYKIPLEECAMGAIHPVSVMSIVQHIALDTHDYHVIVDVGNSLSWTTQYLRFNVPGRFRISIHEAPMGHAACGAVGIASSNTPVLAIVGDGAMLLQNEVNTAVQYGIPIIWLVMNDACYNMCQQVFNVPGASVPQCSIPRVDFALYARGLGATGYSASSVKGLRECLEKAIGSKRPSVIDARIDGNVSAPVGTRAASLASQ